MPRARVEDLAVTLLPADLPRHAALASLHALRLLPVAMLSPFLGGPLAPPVARIALAGGLGVAAYLLRGAPGEAPDALGLLAAGARELAVGLALALAAAAPVEAARAAGRLADTVRGATLAELHVAPIRQRETALGDLLAQWVVVLAAWCGGDRLVVRGLLGSFAALPPGSLFPLAAAREAGLLAAGEILAAAAAVAAPAAAGVLAADLAVAVASRAAPSLAGANGAQPARAALGLLAVAAAASAMAGRLVALVALPDGVAAALARGGTP
jgi:type III secretory pathway component EscT